MPFQPSTSTEDNEELQANELEALQAIYMEDFQWVRAKSAWNISKKLPEFTIHLRPTRLASDSKNGDDPTQPTLSLYLCVKLFKRYPHVPPDLAIKQVQGLSSTDIDALERRIRNRAQEMVGVEMIFEVATTLTEALDNLYERIGAEAELRQRSFHEQMTLRQKERRKEEEERVKREVRDRYHGYGEEEFSQEGREVHDDLHKLDQRPFGGYPGLSEVDDDDDDEDGRGERDEGGEGQLAERIQEELERMQQRIREERLRKHPSSTFNRDIDGPSSSLKGSSTALQGGVIPRIIKSSILDPGPHSSSISSVSHSSSSSGSTSVPSSSSSSSSASSASSMSPYPAPSTPQGRWTDMVSRQTNLFSSSSSTPRAREIELGTVLFDREGRTFKSVRVPLGDGEWEMDSPTHLPPPLVSYPAVPVHEDHMTPSVSSKPIHPPTPGLIST
ncbi:hypothetical protein BJ684DRAFT_15197, partial [Piptocephalis cylindrospora]